MQGQPARRGECLGAFIDQTSVDQTVSDELLQILAGAALHPGRDFFAKEFEKQIRHGGLAGSDGPAGKAPAPSVTKRGGKCHPETATFFR